MTSNKALIQQYLAAYTAFDIPGMLALLAPDVVAVIGFVGARDGAGAAVGHPGDPRCLGSR